MAASDPFPLILLDENDIPGAKLVYKTVEEHSVIQLQRWLECRGLPKTGNKTILLERVNNCIKAGTDKDISVAVDGGKWFDLKVNNIKQNENSRTDRIPYFPLSGWGTFPSIDIPKHFNHGHIHHHLIESVQFLNKGATNNTGSDSEEEDIEDLHTNKPLKRGKLFFTSGHVQRMQDCSKKDHYYVKAKLMSSYKIDVMYDTTVTMSCQSGFIKDASCTCVASAMGRCSHVAALLLAILDYAEKNGYEKRSGTDLPCTWNVGRKRKKDPKKVQDSVKLSSKKKKVHSVIEFDPRPPSLRNERATDTKSSLLWSLGCHRESVAMWNSLLFYEYEDYILDESEKKNLKEKRSLFLNNLSETVQGYDDAVLLVEDMVCRA